MGKNRKKYKALSKSLDGSIILADKKRIAIETVIKYELV